MLRKIPAVVFALACILIAEPLLHAHPLGSDSDGRSSAAGRACGVCAAGVDHLPSTSPAVCVPVGVLYLLTGHETCDVLPAPAVSFDSRGPPLS